ncbi:MAG: oligosaccharide flippase family protein [Bacteroidales bacterium]|nr:oligosaccharide flippase family protein [Bacteroidales bacterium]
MSVYRKLGGQTLIYGLGNIIPRMLNYAILTFYYTRRFSVEEYGMITELYAYVAILMVILTYGMETGLFRFSSLKGNVQKVFGMSFISVTTTSVIFMIIVLVIYKKLAVMIKYEAHPEYIALLGVIISIDAITAIVFAKIRMMEKVRKFAYIKILNVVATIVFVMLFLEVLPEISIIERWAFYEKYMKGIEVGYVFIANLMASILILIVLLPEYVKVRIKFDISLLKGLLKYSIPLLFVGLAGMLNETIERILLRFFLPDQYNVLYEIGIYGANYRIALLMTLFIQMFRYAAEPFFFVHYNKKESKEIYANVLKYFIIFCLLIFLFVMVYLDLIKYFIDSKFYSGLHIVGIILVANIILGILFNVNMWYKLTGKTHYGIYITGLGALLTIVLNIIFIPRYSYVACAWIHLLSNTVMMVITLMLGNKYYKIKYDYKRIVEIVIVAGCLYSVFYLVKSDVIGRNLFIGTLILMAFTYYCIKREKLIQIFLKKET